ncbi:MAG: hypothetical protein AB8B85_05475 [Paracoccaceae bacterium]
MAALLTDFLPVNRGGTPTDGSAGTYYVLTAQELADLFGAHERFAVQSTAGVVNNGGPVLDPHPTTLNFTNAWTKDFTIKAYMTVSNDSQANDFVAELEVDGAVVSEVRLEPKDAAGGAGPTLATVDGGTSATGTDQRLPVVMASVVPLAAGTHTVRVLFASSGAVPTEAAIYQLVLEAEGVS